MIIRGEIAYSNNNPMLSMMVGLPFCSSRALYSDDKAPNTALFKKVMDHKAEIYKGVLTVDNIKTALDKGFFVNISGSFIDKKNRDFIMKEFKDYSINKQCIIDTSPYNICIPHNKEVFKQFDPSKICIPIKGLEDFTDIALILPDKKEASFYSVASLIKRLFSNKRTLENGEDLNSKILLATKYAIDSGYSLIDTLTVLLSHNAFNLSNVPDQNEETLFKISGFDFYSYILSFSAGINDCGYENNDIYLAGLAIQQLPEFLFGEKTKEAEDAFIDKYGLDVYKITEKINESFDFAKTKSIKQKAYEPFFNYIIEQIGHKIEEEHENA